MSKLIERATELMQSVDEFGVTHIITGDGNLEDSHIAFVEKEMRTCTPPPTADERELIALLKAMTIDAREDMWERVAG
jgi:hypothetical protein